MKRITHMNSYRQGHPNPQRYRSEYELLNGEWKFVFDEENQGIVNHFEKEFPSQYRNIIVPYPYQSEASGIGLPEKQCDVIWYEREFDIVSSDQQHIIIFNGVDYKTMIFINGRFAMSHEGGYDIFSVDASPFVCVGRNKITLRIEDKMEIDQIRGKQRWRKDSFTCFYPETSGIVRDVYMEHLNRVHIDDFSFKADYLNRSLTTHLISKNGAETQLKVIVSDAESVLVKEGVFEIKKEEECFTLVLDEIHGWSHENPYLYNIELQLICNGEIKDDIFSYCGFISIQSKDGRFFINGDDTYLKMVLNQGYWQDTITSLTERQICKDIELSLACGFNGARMHEHIPSPLNFYYMDLYGLYMWQECPSAHAYSYQAYKQYFKQFPRMISDHFSHPCIIAYVVFNESWGINEIKESDEEQKLTVDLAALIKKISADRLVISNDGWEHTVSDVITFHNYSETYEELYDLFDSGIQEVLSGKNAECVRNYKNFFVGDFRYCGQPIVYSEFAGIAFAKDSDSGWGYGKSVGTETDFLNKYQGLLSFIYEQKSIRGFCMTQLTDVYQEKNGLFAMDRKSKTSIEAIKAMHDKFKVKSK